MVKLDLEGDKVVVHWEGKPGRSSLYYTMATGNAESANLLSIEEIVAVMMAVKACPFPLGNGKKVYRMCLDSVLAGEQTAAVEYAKSNGLGVMRKAIVAECGDSCNAPNDMYLGIAANEAKEKLAAAS